MNDDPSSRFVELEVLELTENGSYEWKEQARWIKLEEDIEVGSGRWSKPYVPTITYSAIQNYKEFQEKGQALLDLDENTLEGISDQICRSLADKKAIDEEFIPILHATLLTRHHHQYQKTVEGGVLHKEIIQCKRNTNSVDPIDSRSSNEEVTMTFLADYDAESNNHQDKCILGCMSENAEAATILVANVPYTENSIVIFVRLKKSVLLGNLNEVSLPVRFLFLVIGPEVMHKECYQVGRTIGTLMSDEHFGKLASDAQTMSDIISGLKIFLLKSIVLPSGNWDSQLLSQSVQKWMDNKIHVTQTNGEVRRKTTIASHTVKYIEQNYRREEDPLRRTGKLFGGLLGDIKRKLPHIKSDYTDAANFRCLVAIIFIYFSFLAPAITFAALLSEETKGLIGVSEMILATTVSGIVFGLFAGQPLIILGATGPMLVMEESIYHLASGIDVDFLPWRVWIGLWITVFCTLIVAFDLSFLVRKFTLFTEEVVTALISTVFIHESFRFIWLMFQNNYFPNVSNDRVNDPNNVAIFTPCNDNFSNICNMTSNKSHAHQHQLALPFMTIVLMIGTFLTCYYIRKLRHSQYFPSQLRRLLSDFGISLAVLLFLLFDTLMKDDYSPKLAIPDGFTPTVPEKRNWIISVFGEGHNKLSVLAIIFASVPAFLVTIILFMETELTGTIVDRKEYKLKKGSGYNLDLLIVGILASFCSLFGLPWMCACPVHSISHLNSLTIWNRKTAPGTRPSVKKVIEQRVTNILIHFFIGLSVFLAPLLRSIPISVLYGVFLYLGITALSHLKFTQRFKLLFVQAKHHPDYRYIRKIKTYKVHLFTCIQLGCLLIVLLIKNSILAPMFPFFIVLMVPLRHNLKRLFTEEELDELDSDIEDLNDENLDEYDVVHVPM